MRMVKSSVNAVKSGNHYRNTLGTTHGGIACRRAAKNVVEQSNGNIHQAWEQNLGALSDGSPTTTRERNFVVLVDNGKCPNSLKSETMCGMGEEPNAKSA